MITITLVACLGFGIKEMAEKGGRIDDIGIEFIQLDTFTSAIGFSVFAFEGIGIVIPIYEISEDKEGFMKIVYLVFIVVCSLYIVFGMMCIEAFGTELNLPLITSVALPENYFGWLI